MLPPCKMAAVNLQLPQSCGASTCCANPRPLASSPTETGNLVSQLLFSWDLWVLPLGLRGVEEEEGTKKVLSHLCSNLHTPSTHHPSEKVMGNAKMCLPPHGRLLQEGHSGALQGLPSPLPTQHLSSPTLQDPRLPTIWALWAIPSHRQQFHFFTENFRSWSFNSVSEGKKIRSSPILHKMEYALSLPYSTWDARKGSLQRRSKNKGSVLCSTATHCRGDSDWHWLFQLFQKWARWSELEVQRLKDHPFLQDESDQQITRIWQSGVQALNFLKSSFQWKILCLNNPNK